MKEKTKGLLIDIMIYAVAFGKSWKLFLLTLAANCISFGTGLLFFR